MRMLFWLIRREIWENRAIWILPTLIGALLILAAVFGDIDLAPSVILVSPDQPQPGGVLWLFGLGIVLFLVTYLYAIWYLLDSLYVERKDRSVLLWRSLPLSDTYTVVAKLITALFVIPMAGFLAGDIVTLSVALTIHFKSAGSALSALLWSPEQWLQLQVLWAYLIAACAVWYLPLAGWLLVVSSCVRQSPALWAALPILVPYLIERWVLHTQQFGKLVIDRLTGFVSVAFHNNVDEVFSISNVADREIGSSPAGRNVWEIIDASGLLTHRSTWTGLVVGVLLIIAATQLRRRHAYV